MENRRFDASKHAKLVSNERWETWNPPRFLARFEISPGSNVLDLGSGPGFWALPLAEVVGPAGRVFAVDISTDMLQRLSEQNPPKQIIPCQGEATAIPVEAGEIDFAWVGFVFHEIDPPHQCIAELKRVLRPGARLALLDWDPDATGQGGPPTSHRIASHKVIEWLTEAGFTQVEQTWDNDTTYLIEARSPQEAD